MGWRRALSESGGEGSELTLNTFNNEIEVNQSSREADVRPRSGSSG
jgi:hypothetical protein